MNAPFRQLEGYELAPEPRIMDVLNLGYGKTMAIEVLDDVVLGQGNQGVVYEGLLEDGEAVAVKIPYDETNSFLIDRFAYSSAIAQELGDYSDKYVKIHAHSQDPQCLVMEKLEGGDTLENLIGEGVLSDFDKIEIIEQIAEAIEAAESRGIILVDLKPSNVYVVKQGDGIQVKIMDLGIAIRQTDLHEIASKNLYGTADYMAPERIGQNQYLSTSADLYALGVIAYRMFQGELPFKGEFIEVLRSHIEVTPKFALKCKNDDIAVLIAVLMDKDPEVRMTAKETLNEIADIKAKMVVDSVLDRITRGVEETIFVGEGLIGVPLEVDDLDPVEQIVRVTFRAAASL